MKPKSRQFLIHSQPQDAAEADSIVPPPAMDVRSVGWFSIALLPVFLWSFWPTLHYLVMTWDHEADYSHGYMVAPLAAYLLWLKRASFPWQQLQPTAWGLAVIGSATLMRWTSASFYLEPLDGWAMIVWLAGWVLTVGGPALLKWMLPSLGFLLFMVPLPYRVEHALSVPLQRIATQMSCFMLQFLGQPAFAEGTTIQLGEHQLKVEQACSGLRIFIGIFALAVATLMISRREIWERVIIILAVVPIALIANSTRIVITGLLYENVSSDIAKRFSHDLAGWLMILYAAALFMLTIWYMSRLVRTVRISDVVRRQATA